MLKSTRILSLNKLNFITLYTVSKRVFQGKNTDQQHFASYVLVEGVYFNQNCVNVCNF